MLNESVWIGKLFRTDVKTGLSLVWVRGIFQSERDARGIAEAFGCDVLLFTTPDQAVELGQVVVVDMRKTPVVGG